MNFEAFKSRFEKTPVVELSASPPSPPLLSVCVQTYQHAPYIEACIQSILMQQTSFPFEILLGDDASTDGTRELCLEYAKKYPEKIRLFLHHRENNIAIEDKPTGRFNFLFNLFSARGKYIALCEGDDYWTDPLKLQKQVDFLEREPEYVLTCHDASMVDEQGKLLKSSKLPDTMKRDFSAAELRQGPWILTLSACFRNVFQSFPTEMLKVLNGDTFLLSLLGLHGGAKYLPHISPATYRVHSGGIWSQEDGLRKLRSLIRTHQQLLKYYRSKGDRPTAAYFQKSIRQARWRYLKAWVSRKLKK